MLTLVVIPTYNEVENASRIIGAVLALSPDFSVLVVDDASPDGTGASVAKLAAESGNRARLLPRPARLGLGSAYREGLVRALSIGRHGALFVMDCDFSHDPAAIPALLAGLESADVVIGSRYVPGGRILGWRPHRHVLSRTANRVARGLIHLPVRDCTSGFMGFRRSALERLDPGAGRAEAYAAPIELKWRAWRAGLSLAEVPITFRDRERGSSKLDARLVLEAARSLWHMRSAPPPSEERRTAPAAQTPRPSPPGPLLRP